MPVLYYSALLEPILRNRQFVFTLKIEYKLVAERSEANKNPLTFPIWCSRQESNLHRGYRKPISYPLNDESKLFNFELTPHKTTQAVVIFRLSIVYAQGTNLLIRQ